VEPDRQSLRAAALRGRSGRIGVTSSAAAERRSDDLRLGTGEDLARRRAAARALLAGCAALTALGSARPGSAAAALATTGASLTLVGTGGADRPRRLPWAPVATAAKLGLDVAAGGALALRGRSAAWALCAAAGAAALPYALPEARRAASASAVTDRHQTQKRW
jgi:hypothetical protein